MDRLARGDEQALGALYDRYGCLVFSIAADITRNLLAAEEVTQDVFQHVWSASNTCSVSNGTIQLWIVAITRRRAVDVLRGRN